MPVVCESEDAFCFPPLEYADDDGLLVIGGKVTPQRVLEAYPKGIFPWYNEDDWPLWWSPDPRFVLFPKDLHVSRSMQKVFRRNKFTFRTNTAFAEVIEACSALPRTGQDGTWITDEMKQVYIQLHHMGVAQSAEAWQGDRLVGGVYGLRIGKVFFGESMFSKETNASKFAFISFVKQLQMESVQLIDCQVYTEHVESLGAKLIPREDFVLLLQTLTAAD